MTVTSTARELMRRADPLPDSLDGESDASLAGLLVDLTEAVQPDFVVGDGARRMQLPRHSRAPWLVAATVLVLVAGLGTALAANDRPHGSAAPGPATAVAPAGSPPPDCVGLTAPQCAQILQGRAYTEQQRIELAQMSRDRLRAEACRSGVAAALQLAIKSYAASHDESAARATLQAANRGYLPSADLAELWRRNRALLLSTGTSLSVSDKVAYACAAG